MLKYVIKRLLFMVVTLAVVATFLYLALHMSMTRFWAPSSTPFTVIFKFAWRNYVEYVQGVIYHFDFGESMLGEDVWQLVWPKFKLTMVYNITSLVIFVPVGIILGVQAAIHRNKIIDVFISVFSMVFTSIPSFVLIFFLVLYVGYAWELLPPIAPAYSAPLGKQILGMIIPVFALTAGPIGKFSQIVKSELIEITNEDHFLLLRAKGLSQKSAIYRHGVKEALITVIPEIIPTFMLMLGFSFVIESTYNIYGVSKLFLDSMIQKGEMFSQLIIDINVAMAIGMLLYAMIMITGLMTDIMLGMVDPRIQISGRKKAKIMH